VSNGPPTQPDPTVFTSAGRPVYSLAQGDVLLFPPIPFTGSPSPERWRDKAAAYDSGWVAEFKTDATLANIIIGLAIAQHETWCGDAWPNEHNWGAVQYRSPNKAELAVIADAGLTPSPSTVAAARAALAAAAAAGTIQHDPNGALHVDSSPGLGWYWMFFRAFPSDAAGADYFVNVLARERDGVRAVLAPATDPLASAPAVVGMMYLSGYFEGNHPGARPVKERKLPFTPPEQRNVDDYVGSVTALIPGIQIALIGWTPGTVPPEHAIDLTTTAGLQQALNLLKVPGTPLAVDGAFGPLTRGAMTAFQLQVGISADGEPGPLTRSALQTALDKLPPA
jgi:hypothetical protein